jgi:Folylpolyglutamate synthase
LKSKPLTIVGISSDKDYKSMIKSLVEFTDSFVFTKHNVMGRAISPEILEETAKNLSEKITVTKTNSVEEAVKYAIESSKRDDYILVTGSVFTVGEARRYILNEEYDSLFASDPLP